MEVFLRSDYFILVLTHFVFCLQIKAKLIELDDFQLQLKEAISHLDNVLESKNVTSLSESYLNIEPKFQNESCTSLFDKILKVSAL